MTAAWRALQPGVLAASLASPVMGQPAVSPVTQRIIEEQLQVAQPISPCDLPGIVWRVARSVGIPAGIEALPGPCRREPPRQGADVDAILTGLTVGDVLNQLISADPRYWWFEQDGVIVVRPVQAWADREHFLHRTVASFSVLDEHIGGALDTVSTALGPYRTSRGSPHALRTPEANRPISVQLGATSILNALTAVVRAHGAALWRLTYCRPTARHEHATIWLEAHDGGGLGRHAAVLRRPDGRRYSPCMEQETRRFER